MLSDCLIVGIHASGISVSIPVGIVRVNSYVNSFLNSTRVPVRVSGNKRNFVPERIMPGLIGVFRNGRSLSL